MPKVSVIMPTHNRGFIITRAIQSVLRQTYTNFELIIIDDCSTDDTKNILTTLTDRRIRIYFLKEKQNVSVARNIAITKARANLIAYLDTDNLWYPNYLDVMVSEFTRDTVLLYSGQNTFLVDGTKENPHIIGRSIRNNRYNPAILPMGNYIDINAVIHTKKILDDIGMFDEKLTTCVDWDLFVRIAIRYPFNIRYVSQVLGEYYFYLKDTLSTITNGYASDQELRKLFNVQIPTGDDKYIQEKVQKLLKEKK